MGLTGPGQRTRGVGGGCGRCLPRLISDGNLEVVDRAPWALVTDELGLEDRFERFSQGVIVAVTGGADRGDGAGIGEPLG